MITIVRAFADGNLQDATLGLLQKLGIKMSVRTRQAISVSSVLREPSQAVQGVINKIETFYLVGAISDKSFTADTDTDDTYETLRQADDRYPGMFVFAADFQSDAKLTRSEMAILTRALNRASKAAPVVVSCRYREEGEVRFALSLCERTAYVQSGYTGEKAGRVNILRSINPLNPHTGHIRILEDMRLEKKEKTFEAVYTKWLGVFDNDVLTNQFYKELQDWYFWALKPESGVTFPNDIDDDTDDAKYNPQNIIRLITRLIFVWFLRQKSLVPKQLFNREDLDRLVKYFEPDNFESSTYYRVILQNLFFATLNKKIDEREFINDNFIVNRNQGKHKIKTFMRHASDLKVSKEEFIALLRPVPFMNNSLFECLDNKEQNGHTFNWDGFSDSNKSQKQAFIPNYLFFAKEEYVDLSKEYDRNSASSVKVFGLLNILKRYNFTVEENTPLDQDVALDPELLGKVFENLLAAYNPETKETVRKSTGSYYTPRPIVQYMVDESLVAYLKKSVPDVEEETFRSLLSYNDDSKANPLNEVQTRSVVKALLNCKVLDPACGSGAFPMGMLQQMSHLLSRVDADNHYWEEVVMERALNDAAFVEKTGDKEKEARKHEIEEVFRLSVEYPDYARKLYLIENCIYGVDLQSIAVQISRLRFFISLLCEQQPDLTKPEKNYNVKPLPNLEMKFVCANSLVRLEHIDEARELFGNRDILDLIEELKAVRHELFVVTDNHVKERLLAKDETLRSQIMLSTGDSYVKDTEEKIKTHEQILLFLEVELAEAEKMSDEIITEAYAQDLFGEKVEQISYSPKERRIKAINSRIRNAKSEIKRLRESLVSGRDKAMRLAKQLTDWNPYDQNVSSPFFDAEWMFGVNGGFDVVIGNPPYVRRTKINDVDKEYYEKKYISAYEQYDLYFLFIECGLSLLNKESTLYYINPIKFLISDSGLRCRELLLKEYTLKFIADVSQISVFDASTYPCIIAIENKKSTEDNLYFEKFPSIHNTIQSCNFTRHRKLTSYFDDKYLRIVLNDNQSEIEIINKVEKLSKEFSTFFKNQRGIANNKVKFNQNQSIGIKSTNVEKYGLVGDFVNVKVEEKRVKEFKPEMVIMPRTSKSLKAAIKPKELIVLDRIYYISQKENRFNNAYIVGILNSKLIAFWFSYYFDSERIRGGYFDLKGPQIDKIPILTHSVAQQQPIISLVETILEKKCNGEPTEQEEREIDLLVYRLYGLTYAEVKTIDPETDITEKEYGDI